MFNRKYKLIKDTAELSPAIANGDSANPLVCQMYRVKALRDIPEYGVKKGDIGGQVTGRHILSQEGSCWIADDAKAFGNVRIEDNAYVSGNARLACFYDKSSVTVSGNATVADKALVYARPHYRIEGNFNTLITDFAEVLDEAFLCNVKKISGSARIYGNAWLQDNTVVSDTSQVFGDAELDEYSSATGNSLIFGNVILGRNSHARNSSISGCGFSEQYVSFFEEELVLTVPKQETKESTSPEQDEAFNAIVEHISDTYSSVSIKAQRAIRLFDEVTADIAAYETDIVKIIQYPSMTDRAVPETRAMIVALKRAKRLADEPDTDEFTEAVADLEDKFLAAEAVALKVASTSLTVEEKKKTEKARDLLAVAADEASSENEKAQAFKQAFKQLEGVIIVPEVAIDTFRVKIGLKELEG